MNFLTAEDRRDFSTDVITVRFEADQTGPQVNEVTASVPIIDDDIDEAPEEVFMIDLTLLSSINTLTRINRRSSLCIINDNDGRYMYNDVLLRFDQSIIITKSIKRIGSSVSSQIILFLSFFRLTNWFPECQLHIPGASICRRKCFIFREAGWSNLRTKLCNHYRSESSHTQYKHTTSHPIHCQC